jgi:para-aminobenzoate synthetase component 1
VLLPPARAWIASRELSPALGLLARFEALRGRPYPWLLDSSLPSARLGRWSFAGAEPYAILRVRGELSELECRRAVHPGLRVGLHRLDSPPLEALRAFTPPSPEAGAPLPMPFAGGAVGYFGYELAGCFEALPAAAEDELGVPDAVLLLVDRVLAYDHLSGSGFAVGLGFGETAAAARASAERAADEVALASEQPSERRIHRQSLIASASDTFDESAYAKAIERAREEIAAGNVYQACLTRRLERGFGGDPWELHLALRRRNPAPFACFFELPEATIVGSSPERFLLVGADGLVQSRPIKGTRPRGGDPVQDERERRALLASAKDRAENLMIVDLVRNDLGRVCELGSVRVPELMAVEEYASVFHLVSTVSGRLRRGCDALDALRAAFPPGSMTGAPKLAAMRLLRQLEPVRRGVYSGAIGYLDARGGADLAVVIRTLVLARGRAFLHTGGGIVADSEPEAEWRETVAKAAPLLAALEAADRLGAPGLSCRAFAADERERS